MTDAIHLPPDSPTPIGAPEVGERISLASAAATLDRLEAQHVFTQPHIDAANPHGTEARYYLVSRSTVSAEGIGDLGVKPLQLQYEARRDAALAERQARGDSDALSRSGFVDFAISRRSGDTQLGFVEAQVVDGPLFTNHSINPEGRLVVEVGPDTRRLELRMDLRHLPTDPSITAHVAEMFEDMALAVDATHISVFTENGPECASLVAGDRYDLAPDGRRQFAEHLTEPDRLGVAVRRALEVGFARELGEGEISEHEMTARTESGGRKLAADLNELVAAVAPVAPGTSARDRMAGAFTWTADKGTHVRPGSPWSEDTIRSVFEAVPQSKFAEIGAVIGGRHINIGEMLLAGCTAPLISLAVDGSIPPINPEAPALPELRYESTDAKTEERGKPSRWARIFPPSGGQAVAGIAGYLVLQRFNTLPTDILATASWVLGGGSVVSYFMNRGKAAGVNYTSRPRGGGRDGFAHDMNNQFQNDYSPDTNTGVYDTYDGSSSTYSTGSSYGGDGGNS
jgi:hypothetical protein